MLTVKTVDDAATDYVWKGDLVNEQTQRLSMWYATHYGETYSSGAIQLLRSTLDEFIKREQDFKIAGQKYKDLLLQYSSQYDPQWVSSTINTIDQNEGISNNDQEMAIENYQTIEKQYLLQEQIQSSAIGAGLLLIGSGILYVMLWKRAHAKKGNKQE